MNNATSPDQPPTHADHTHGGHRHAAHAPGIDTATDQRHPSPAPMAILPVSSVLGWPAWQRVLAVLPVLLLLWLAVGWASAGLPPW